MKKLLPLMIFMVFAAIAVFWLLDWGDAPELTGSNTDDSLETARTTDIEFEKPAQPDDDPAKANDTESRITPDKDKPETQDESLEPVLYKSDYGPLLRRGGGKIDFKLVDANGRECELEGEIKVKLYRQLGRYWQSEEASINRWTNRIECHGHSILGQAGVGLEPGSYELEFRSIQWGDQRYQFVVNRGEIKEIALRSLIYLRRICFEFRDQHGNAVPWIQSPPYVDIPYKDTLQKKARPNPKLNFLVVPPADRSTALGGGIGGGGGRGGSGGFYRYKHMYPTDDGRWYVNVWAGVESTVRLTLNEKIWGIASLGFKSRFTEASWDNHVVTIDLPEDFAEKAQRLMKIRDVGSKGRMQETLDELNRTEKDPLKTELPRGRGRIIATVEPEIAGEPIIVRDDPAQEKCKFHYASRQWIAEVPSGEPLSLYVRYGLSMWKCQSIVIQDGETKIVTLKPPVVQPAMSTQGMPKTLTNSALGFKLGVDFYDPEKKEFSDVTTDFYFDYDQGEFRHRGIWQFDADTIGPDYTHTEIRVVFYTAPVDAYWPIGGRSHSATSTKQESGADGLLDHIKEQSWEDNFHGHIFLRVVGDDKEGLPWTQGIIQPFEDDKVAQQIRNKSQLEDGSKLSINIKDYESSGYESKWDDLNPDTDEYDKNLAALVGKKNAKVLTTTEERLWFAKYGAWYKSDSKVYSDDHGYIHGDYDLIPGKLYVLYLWSNSRNDLEPDRRIVFKAGERHTDLGVVRIPSYR